MATPVQMQQMQGEIEARMLGLLNEQRRAMGEEAQAQTARLNAQIEELRGVAQAQDTEGRSLVQQLEDARRGIVERGERALSRSGTRCSRSCAHSSKPRSSRSRRRRTLGRRPSARWLR